MSSFKIPKAFIQQLKDELENCDWNDDGFNVNYTFKHDLTKDAKKTLKALVDKLNENLEKVAWSASCSFPLADKKTISVSMERVEEFGDVVDCLYDALEECEDSDDEEEAATAPAPSAPTQKPE
jgi:hypothetical protein